MHPDYLGGRAAVLRRQESQRSGSSALPRDLPGTDALEISDFKFSDCRETLRSDVTTVLGAIELDPLDGGVGFGLSFGQGGPERRYTKHASAIGDAFIPLSRRAGMEHLHAGQRGGFG